MGSLVVVLGYTQLAISDALFTELFPTELRGSGQGFCCNSGRGFAALFLGLVENFASAPGAAP